jgi:toxin-antitoxin system PIN domain toxin
MIILDANVLVYAYNKDAPQHIPVARWLNGVLDSGDTIGLPWPTMWAFVRICTNPRILPNPLPAKEAFRIVGEWLEQPAVKVIDPGPCHAEILEALVLQCSAAGALLTDAVLAALALEYGAALASTDQDFRRFPEVRWIDPLHR